MGPLEAAVITTQFADLSDAVPGQDLWQASYSLGGPGLNAGQGFTLYYAHDRYRDLTSVAPPSHPGWDLLVVQPDPGLPDAGFFDGLALVDSPSLAPPFVLTFVWLGGGAGPEQQPFELYDLTGGFSIIDSGTTIPVPEPEAGALLIALAGCGGLLFRRARAQQTGPVAL